MDKQFCLFGHLTDPNDKSISKCMFDYWSLFHFYFTGFFYLILHHLLNINNMKDALFLLLFITVAHAVEEYQGNTSKLSLEGIFFDKIATLFDPKLDPNKRELDDDTLENSVGDVLSGVISSLLIVWYWNQYKILPYWYLYGVIAAFLDLYRIRKRFY